MDDLDDLDDMIMADSGRDAQGSRQADLTPAFIVGAAVRAARFGSAPWRSIFSPVSGPRRALPHGPAPRVAYAPRWRITSALIVRTMASRSSINMVRDAQSQPVLPEPGEHLPDAHVDRAALPLAEHDLFGARDVVLECRAHAPTELRAQHDGIDLVVVQEAAPV